MKKILKFKAQRSKLIILEIIFVLFLNIIPTKTQAAVSASAIFNLTNSARVSNGLSPLSMDEQLNQAAQMKAQDMLNNGYFAHTSPSGLNSWYWFRQVGYNYKTAGENLAIDFSDSNRVFNAWMASPSHRDNILDPDFTEIGIAAVTGNFNGSITTVVVQMFGARSGATKISSKNTFKNSIPAKKSLAERNSANNPANDHSNDKAQNQEYSFTVLNEVFNKFKLVIDNLSNSFRSNFKGIFISQIILAMLI